MSKLTRRRALAVLGALPALSFAANQRAPLRLTMVNLMPWAGIDAQGRPTGALVDLTALLAKASGVPLTPLLVPYGRAPYMLNSGGTDLMTAIDIRIKGSDAIEHLGAVDIVVFGLNGFRFQQLGDLHGKTVGYLRHSSYSPELEVEPGVRRHPFDSYEQGVRMLRAGRLDAIIGVGNSIEYALRKQDAGADVSARYPLARGRVALYAERDLAADTSAALQAGCRDLRQKQTLEKLLQQYQRL